MPEIIMPKMGDAMTEGRIVRWMKQPGEAVRKGEPIAEIETDKVNVDLEAEWDGVVARILVGAGEVAPVGAPIAVLDASGATPDRAATPPPMQAPRPAAPAVPEDTPEPASTLARGPATPAPPGAVRASPLARRLAAQHGISLASIAGTGPEGRITKEDVEAAIAAASRPPVPAARAPVGPPTAAAPPADVPLTRMRQTIARRMTESKQRVPHIYIAMTITMDAALALRKQLNEGQPEAARISINDMVVRAAALALTKFPALNASFTGEAIRYNTEININIGVALPEGLIAPTLYHCDRKSLWEIATDSRTLAERARTGRLRPEDLTGGTFTISNLGMYGVEVFSAIINPPQAAILAVGAASPRPVVRDGTVVVATTMQATVSADHRVTDGAEVAKFLGEVKRLLENPVWLVASPPQA
ncbi:MAG: dihydrolipoamide acetyltransferase family protein [Armatimonadota bacterium]|nr:dihydrolipoamide acetyltransferase family protein [Armatimonadota bacterium]